MSELIKFGKELAEQVYQEINSIVLGLDRVPKLGILQVGSLPASNRYIKHKKKRIENLGWEVAHVNISETSTEHEFKQAIKRLATDATVDGIIIQLPVPYKTQDFFDLIPHYKDVDGLCSYNQAQLCRETDENMYLAPCTAKGCMYFLEQNNIQISGSHVGVFGRSCLVGKPISLMLQKRGATVVCFNIHDKRQWELSKHCDILISAIGSPHYITREYVKKDAMVVDIGITEADGIICGDVHPEVQSVASIITPTIGGIGPLTVAFLMKNLAQACVLRKTIPGSSSSRG